MTKTIPCLIQYDTRGFGPKAKEYKDAIIREFPNAELAQLPIGDLVCGNACIELKTIPDFLSSITDGRLAHQPVHMKENFSHPLILILGSFTDILAQNIYNGVYLKSRLTPEELKDKKQIRIHENSIFATLVAIVVRHKVPVMLLEDLNVGSLFAYINHDDPLYPKYMLECMDIRENGPIHRPGLHALFCSRDKFAWYWSWSIWAATFWRRWLEWRPACAAI